jgi:hypothetical protein
MALVLQANADGAADDHRVMQGRWQLGRIYKRQNALRPETQWHWNINGVYRGPADLRLSGFSGTLDEALAALKESRDTWLALAQLTETGTDRTPRVLSVVISKSD